MESNGFSLKEINIDEIVERYIESDYTDSVLLGTLFCAAWPALEGIYYNQHSGIKLSAEECYDIFVDTFNYIIKSAPWKKKDSSLYNDKNAFVKAMKVCIKHRKMNYVNAQFKLKRVANTGAVSLDYLNDEFQEGYFLNDDYIAQEDTGYIFNDIDLLIISLFKEKKYLDAYSLDVILNGNVFIEEQFSIKKLRKVLRNLDEGYAIYFSNKYDLNKNEILYSYRYFKSYNNEVLNEHINNCLQNLSHSDIINQVLF